MNWPVTDHFSPSQKSSNLNRFSNVSSCCLSYSLDLINSSDLCIQSITYITRNMPFSFFSLREAINLLLITFDNYAFWRLHKNPVIPRSHGQIIIYQILRFARSFPLDCKNTRGKVQKIQFCQEEGRAALFILFSFIPVYWLPLFAKVNQHRTFPWDAIAKNSKASELSFSIRINTFWWLWRQQTALQVCYFPFLSCPIFMISAYNYMYLSHSNFLVSLLIWRPLW